MTCRTLSSTISGARRPFPPTNLIGTHFGAEHANHIVETLVDCHKTLIDPRAEVRYAKAEVGSQVRHAVIVTSMAMKIASSVMATVSN
jgi:hypothetical protein